MSAGVPELCRTDAEFPFAGTAGDPRVPFVAGEPRANVVLGHRLVDIVGLSISHGVGNAFAEVVGNDHIRLKVSCQRGPHLRRDEIAAGFGYGRRSFVRRPLEGIAKEEVATFHSGVRAAQKKQAPAQGAAEAPEPSSPRRRKGDQ